MLLRKLFGSKSYFAKMVLGMSAATLLVVLVLILVVYMNTQRLLIKNEYAANQKVLYQVKYNINLMDQTIDNLCNFLYVNGDVAKIMYAEKEDMVDVSVRLNTIIRSLATANPYIHSISIYNHALNQFYDVGNSIFFEDPMVRQFYQSGEPLPILTPVIRNVQRLVDGKQVPEQLFSYFIYDPGADGKQPDGVVVVNVEPEWLMNNIRQINAIDRLKGDRMFILNDKGEFLTDNSQEPDYKEWLKQQYIRFKQSHPDAQSDGFFQKTYGGTRYLITYSHVENAGMTLLKTQPVSEVYQSISRLKTSIIIITLIFLAVALLISFRTSQMIYKPFGKLVHSIRSDKGSRLDEDEGDSDSVDEIHFLGSVYRQSMKKLEHLHEEKFRYQNVMKNYWLNQLLIEGPEPDRTELEQTFSEMRIALPLDGPYAVIVLKIDKYKDFQQVYSPLDQETIRFAIINIASELVGKYCPNEGLDMKDDHVLLIAHLDGLEDKHEKFDFPSGVAPLLREAQETVARYFKVSFSASVSDTAIPLRSLAKLYSQSLDQAAYRFVLGHSCIVSSDSIRDYMENKQAGYSRNREEALLQALRVGDWASVEENLNQIFQDISALDYHHAVVSVIRLADAIKGTLADFPVISRFVLEKETIGEIRDFILRTLRDTLADENGEKDNAQNHYVVDAVKAFIQQNYGDPELTLTSIASMIKVSARQLSKIFREATTATIPGFINDVRLVKAAELLATRQMSVHEIVEQVGITNETYFFSLFKKRYGVTPKEYALQKKANQLLQSEAEDDDS